MTFEVGADIELFDEHASGARELLERFEREILEQSFPPNEYVPSPYSRDQRYEPVLIACGPDGSILGGACGQRYPESNALLLAYLAVRQELRGLGVGSRLMEVIRERWLSPSTLALVEIEDPRHHSQRVDYGDPVGRIRFYARSGVKAIAIPYFQPRLARDLPRAYHLILGTLAVPKYSRIGAGIAGTAIARFLREHFVGCEGTLSVDDIELQWLLTGCRARELPLVALEDLVQIPDPEPPSAVSPS